MIFEKFHSSQYNSNSRVSMFVYFKILFFPSLSLSSYFSQAFQGAFLLLVAINSINTEDQSRLKKVRILNYIAMSLSFGILVADTIKMVFVQDENYGLK